MRYFMKLFTALALVIILAAPPAGAATIVIAKNGKATVSVPASQFINVFTEGTARVFKSVGGPSSSTVARFVLETGGNLSAGETIYGPYTIATSIRIEAGSDAETRYSVGAGALPIPVSRVMPGLSPSSGSIFRIPSRVGQLQPVPTAKTTAVTLTAAELLTGIITGTHTAGATQAYTLPTGTLLEAAVPFLQIGEGFEWNLINLSAAAADSITVTAGTDHTIVGDPVVISVHVTTGGSITSRGCSSSTWITKKSAANTFITFRKN